MSHTKAIVISVATTVAILYAVFHIAPVRSFVTGVK
jgi:hypothetical protein